MPENVNLNSVRMQRAQRINNIEDARLMTRIHLLDKERRHRMRVANQDMRMVSLTLEYIQSSSGYSPEALPPDYVEPQVDKEPEPYFMYGERLRRLKSRRVQSAPNVSRSREPGAREGTDKDGSDVSPGKLTEGKRKGWGSAYLPMERISEDSCGQGAAPSGLRIQASIRPKTSGPREAFVSSPLVMGSGTDTSLEAVKATKEDIEKTLERSKEEFETEKMQRKQVAHGRKAAITQAVNKVRVMTTSARRLRNVTPMQALVLAPQKTMKQREAWEQKVSINSTRNQRLEAKLRIFMSSYPRQSVPGFEA